MGPNILIVEDELIILNALKTIVKSAGYKRCHTAHSIDAALEFDQKSSFDIVFLDIKLGDQNSLKFLHLFLSSKGRPEVVIVTGQIQPKWAELAFQQGIWKYIQKPFVSETITNTIEEILNFRYSQPTATDEGKKKSIFNNEYIGTSPQFLRALESLVQATNCDATVLISGETGTGKRHFARLIHDNSPYKSAPFVEINCRLNLIEDKIIIEASGGTLFLSGVEDLSKDAQRQLEGLLESYSNKSGGALPFRLISSNIGSLERLASDGQFREDLLYRIKGLRIQLPPLRDRLEDIRPLANHFSAKLCEHYKIPAKGLSESFVSCLESYSWPGNILELISVIDNATINAFDLTALYPKHLPSDIRLSLQIQTPKIDLYAELFDGTEPDTSIFPSFNTFKFKSEKLYITRLMKVTKGNVDQACDISGLHKSRIYQLLRAKGLKREDFLK